MRIPLSKNFLAVLLAATPLIAFQYVEPGELKPLPSQLRDAIERYQADRGNLTRFNDVPTSPQRRDRMKKFYSEWLAHLSEVNFDAVSQEDRVDYLLFRNHLQHELRQLDIQAKSLAETAPLTPFSATIIGLEETRRRMELIDSPKAAVTLDALKKQVDALRKSLEAELKNSTVKKSTAYRAAMEVDSLRATLKNWNGFYAGYDPIYSWWAAEPYKSADQALQNYATFLREKIAGVNTADKEAINGVPIGREALLSELAYEMIPYTPEELIDIANREFAWCENEMKRASRELGYGDDWHKALEYVKTKYVDPGKQPEMIRDLAREAVAFLDQHDLITIPQLARDTWRMEMMTPERQLVAPFFLGGEVIQVSYPTNTMTEEQKMMSMRGNNLHFSRATVFHELIPGHHLQGFMAARYRPYRQMFRTPFATEGWALYWELLMWDLKFQKTPEDRIGALFWRMHRCARIIFSLSFHLEKMSAQECVDFLVERVGHERENAAGEVRRSFNGSYGPLYQCAYLLGGFEFHGLHRELVDSGKMTNRAFHDAILREGPVPVEMIRASLTNAKLTRDFTTAWRFYGATP